MPFYVFPSTDLHLITGASVPMRPYGSSDGSWLDISSEHGFVLQQFDILAAIATMAGTTIETIAGRRQTMGYDLREQIPAIATPCSSVAGMLD